MSIVRHKIYGNDEKPTIYYLTGYGGRVKQYLPHLYALMLGGFRIFIFEYDKSILNAGDPHKLLEAMKDIEETVNKDKQKREIAGLYGVSLGSWLGLNVVVACGLKKGMFNTGATSIVKVVWDNPRLKAEKEAFKKHGYDRKALERLWCDYDFCADGNRYKGKQLVVMNSTKDEIMDINEAKQNVRGWQQDNVDVEFITSGAFKHGPAIARHMLRLKKTIRFFKNTKKDKQQVVSWSGTESSNRRG